MSPRLLMRFFPSTIYKASDSCSHWEILQIKCSHVRVRLAPLKQHTATQRLPTTFLHTALGVPPCLLPAWR